MKNIVIAEGITATLSNKTYNAMCEYNARTEQLSQWMESAFNDRDWGDYEHYSHLQEQLDIEFSWLWGY